MLAFCFYGCFLSPVSLPKILHTDQKQAKRLAGLFFAVGVVRTVSPQDSATVAAIQLAKPFKALMDVDIVNEKINEAVNGNANSNEGEPKPTRYI